MKQYQIITFIVICLTVFTVYQIQRGLLSKTHNFLVESIEQLPDGSDFLPASSDAASVVTTEKQAKPEVAKKAVTKEKIVEVKRCAEVKVIQKQKCTKAAKVQVKTNPSEAKIRDVVLVKDSSPISGLGCMGFILF